MADAQDPLAQLEELLKKTKGQQAAAPAAPPAAPAAPPAAPAEPTVTPDELAAVEAAREAERQAALEVQHQEMIALHDTPQYQARQQYQAQAAVEKKAESDANTGHEIRQITELRVAE